MRNMQRKSPWKTFISRLFAADLKDYSYEIRHENMTGLLIFLLIGEFVAATALSIQLIFGRQGNFAHCIEMTIYFAILLCCYVIYRNDWQPHATAWLYSWEIVAMIMIIFQATEFDTDQVSFMVPICLIIMPLLVVDVPWRLFAVILIEAVGFLMLDAQTKPLELFARDLSNILWAVPVSCLLSYRNIYGKLLGKVEKRTAVQSAEHDALTGIMNRRGGEQMVREALARGESGSFIILDIDNFKQVNDTYGHGRGDEILIEVAAVLKKCFRENDTVFRMGGDEFIVYAPSMVDVSRVEQKLAQICTEMRKVVLNREEEKFVTVSIGCAINLGSYPDYEALYETADYFLYQTKQRSKNGYSVSAADYKAEQKIIKK